jgi:hypothetical protein
MSRQSISLKSRVRYEGRVQTFDRRATVGADLEKLPEPLWYRVGQILRAKSHKPAVATPAPKAATIPASSPTSTAAQDT